MVLEEYIKKLGTLMGFEFIRKTLFSQQKINKFQNLDT